MEDKEFEKLCKAVWEVRRYDIMHRNYGGRYPSALEEDYEESIVNHPKYHSDMRAEIAQFVRAVEEMGYGILDPNQYTPKQIVRMGKAKGGPKRYAIEPETRKQAPVITRGIDKRKRSGS